MNLDGEVILNEELLNQLALSEEEINEQENKAKDVIEKREKLFRKGKPFPSLEDKVAILVDDGLASGYTMLAAIRFVKRRAPEKIVVAVPTASKRTIEIILPKVDELVCLNVRHGAFFAVADAYINWYDLSDEEVLSLLSPRI